LKYSWSEKSITLARKAFQKVKNTGFGSTSGAVKMQYRSDAVLHMTDAMNAWVTYAAHFRAANVGTDALPDWQKTSNPHIVDMVGVFGVSADKAVKSENLFGFEATLACGTRKEMHDLPIDFDMLKGNFRECVKKGAATNAGLRQQEKPFKLTKPFFAEEVVIRVTFKPLSGCQKDMVDAASITDEEKVNPVYKNFAQVSGCTPSTDSTNTHLAATQKEADYRGLLYGSGLPEETLLEVLIDPADFLQEVTL
jgi:hypothetical protein